MKILFNCHTPFSFAHGGAQIQIEQTMAALKKSGVDVAPLFWYDSQQNGDIIHHFGRIPPALIKLAHARNVRVVATAFEGGAGQRSRLNRFLLGSFRRTVRAAAHLIPPWVQDHLTWEAYQQSDAVIAMTPYEAELIRELFLTQEGKIHFVPNGVESVFLEASDEVRGKWIVCTGSIIPVKQVHKLAEMAIISKSPVWFIGKPFDPDDPYAVKFADLCKTSEYLRYDGPISDRMVMAQAYRQARGFVLLSKWESLSLAALEASACGCPLLLSDLPWATKYFKNNATYCRADVSPEVAAQSLRKFYDNIHLAPLPQRPLSWMGVAEKLIAVYGSLLK